MPNLRTPLAKAKLTGADKLHPSRFKDRVEPDVSKLGPPSIFLSPSEQAAWEAFKIELPWLAESDRAMMEIVCRLRAEFWEKRHMAVAKMVLLRQCLGQLGASPADRSKITEPDASKHDPLAKFS